MIILILVFAIVETSNSEDTAIEPFINMKYIDVAKDLTVDMFHKGKRCFKYVLEKEKKILFTFL